MRRGRDSWEKVTPEMENKWLEEDVEESVKEEEEEEERGRVCSRLGREDGCKVCWWSNRFLRCEHCTKELQKELKEIDRKREAEKELQKEIETEIEEGPRRRRRDGKRVRDGGTGGPWNVQRKS